MTTLHLRSFSSITFAICSALLVASVLAPADAAAMGPCQVTFRMTTADTLATLLMTSDYSAADGEFDGEFGDVGCTDLTGTMPIFNDNEAAELLGLTFFAFNGFTGPLDIAVCIFVPNGAAPVPGDFVSNIEQAGAQNGSPVEGVQVVVSQIDCEGGGTTTTTTTIATTSTLGATTTTMISGSCADPDENGITATDALFILSAAIGLQSCELCECDADGSGMITATDALLTLRAAVGSPVELACPVC